VPLGEHPTPQRIVRACDVQVLKGRDVHVVVDRHGESEQHVGCVPSSRDEWRDAQRHEGHRDDSLNLPVGRPCSVLCRRGLGWRAHARGGAAGEHGEIECIARVTFSSSGGGGDKKWPYETMAHTHTQTIWFLCGIVRKARVLVRE
jgi:hypothetical protein